MPQFPTLEGGEKLPPGGGLARQLGDRVEIEGARGFLPAGGLRAERLCQLVQFLLLPGNSLVGTVRIRVQARPEAGGTLHGRCGPLVSSGIGRIAGEGRDRVLHLFGLRMQQAIGFFRVIPDCQHSRRGVRQQRFDRGLRGHLLPQPTEPLAEAGERLRIEVYCVGGDAIE